MQLNKHKHIPCTNFLVYNKFVQAGKLNMNSDLLIELAQLGLSGNKNDLLKYLKTLAAKSADERKITLYKKLSELLDEYESAASTQWHVSGMPVGQSLPIRNEQKLWFPKQLEGRIELISKLLSDQTLPEDIKVKYNRILLYGVPGTGKTTIGLFLAKKMGYPIKYVKVSDVISYKFGETLKNISEVFNDQGASIVFIDEFDAFAKSRFDSNDVGELKRIVNSLIQTLDMLPSSTVVIVATNLIETIDPAISRRFPIKVHVDKLNKAERAEFIKFLIEDAYIPIKLSKKDMELFDTVLREADLKTVDAIKGAIDSSIVAAHVQKQERIELKDILISMLNNGAIDSNVLKNIGETKPSAYSELINQFAYQYNRSDLADILGMHRNSLLNYGKDI